MSLSSALVSLLSSWGGPNKFYVHVHVQRLNEDVSKFCVSHYSVRQLGWTMRGAKERAEAIEDSYSLSSSPLVYITYHEDVKFSMISPFIFGFNK